CMVENGRVVALPSAETEGVNEPRGVFWRPGPMPPGWAMEQVLPTLTDTAIGYIQRRVQSAPAQPFFLYLPLTAPHTPWVPLDSLRGRSKAGRYGDFVAQVDQSVGQLLAALDRLGIAEHTLVLFSSDNGAHWTPADQAQYAHRANAPYAGMKADLLEGGHRVPFLVRWPEQVQSGQRSEALLCLTDVYATLAGLTGQAMPAGSAEDSYSFLPLLQGEALPDRPPVVHHSVSGRFALRAGDWKYYPLPGSGGWTEPVGPRRPVAGDPAEAQLYHLPSDPTESNNRLSAEPALADSLARLLAPYRALGWRE
ncbi:MAG: sulfatase, partial [Bacteroidetes bacterium]